MKPEEVTFDNPFFDRMAKYPMQFCRPVFFGQSPHFSYAAALNSGTATFVKLEGRFLAVTCHHVLEAYRRARTAAETVFQIGEVLLDPEGYLVSEDRDRDLTVIELTRFVGCSSDLTEAMFVQPIVWPPQAVSVTDILCLGGYPGVWREQMTLGHLRFHTFSTGTGEILSVDGEKIVTTIQLQDSIIQNEHGRVQGSLGGLSGGPVFAWRKTPLLVAELVGFIYEYQESFDLMFVRKASVMASNGSFL